MKLNSEKYFEILSQYVEFKKRGSRYFILCPFHHETNPSCHVNFEKGVFYCFGCQTGGTIAKLILKITGKRVKEFVDLDRIVEGLNKNKKENSKKSSVKNVYDISIFPSVFDNHILLKYFEKRGIDLKVVEEFNIRAGVDKYAGRLVFPYYEDEDCVGFIARSVYAGSPKYLYPDGFRSSDFLYGLHKVKGKEVFIVEGVFDVLRLYQDGIEAVALGGKSISKVQFKTIINKFEKVVIALDGDAFEDSKKHFNALKGWVDIEIIKLPFDKDPADLGKRILDYKIHPLDIEFCLVNNKEKRSKR